MSDRLITILKVLVLLLDKRMVFPYHWLLGGYRRSSPREIPPMHLVRARNLQLGEERVSRPVVAIGGESWNLMYLLRVCGSSSTLPEGTSFWLVFECTP
jgi:hypothetical protein